MVVFFQFYSFTIYRIIFYLNRIKQLGEISQDKKTTKNYK